MRIKLAGSVRRANHERWVFRKLLRELSCAGGDFGTMRRDGGTVGNGSVLEDWRGIRRKESCMHTSDAVVCECGDPWA